MTINKIFTVLLYLLLFTTKHSFAQELVLEPNIGINYYGLSKFEENRRSPADFKASSMAMATTFGLSIKYVTNKLHYVLSIQSVSLGPSFIYSNIFLNKGIVPSFQSHHYSTYSNYALIGYGIELKKKLSSKIIATYHLQSGIGINRGKEYYDNVMPRRIYRSEFVSGYEQYSIAFYRKGLGVFLTGKTGISFINKKGNESLKMIAFFNKGLLKMARYEIDYSYGYYDFPEYTRKQHVNLASTGTGFGLSLAVPIRILRSKAL